MTASNDATSSPARRSFLTKFLAGLAAAIALLGPIASGVVVLLDPLSRKKKSGQWIRVATLDALPADGKPHRFAVVDQNPTDKWNRYDPQPIGSIYLSRDSETATPVALNAVCPHLGCNVDYSATKNVFRCPCHNADFTTEGKRTVKKSVSPRDLDPMVVEIRKDNQIWVDYRQYKAGIEALEEV